MKVKLTRKLIQSPIEPLGVFIATLPFGAEAKVERSNKKTLRGKFTLYPA